MFVFDWLKVLSSHLSTKQSNADNDSRAMMRSGIPLIITLMAVMEMVSGYVTIRMLFKMVHSKKGRLAPLLS